MIQDVINRNCNPQYRNVFRLAYANMYYFTLNVSNLIQCIMPCCYFQNIGPIWTALLFSLLKVPVPLNTLEYIIERQDEYEKAKLQRANPEHQKKR